MKPEVARQLADALRSGEYKEGPTAFHRQYLKSISHLQGDGPSKEFYNPYGVLADLYLWETGKGEWKREKNSTNFFFLVDWDQCHVKAGFLPEIWDWAGVEEHLVTIKGTDIERKVKDIFLEGQSIYGLHNPKSDWDQLSFSELADLIEKEYCVES